MQQPPMMRLHYTDTTASVPEAPTAITVTYPAEPHPWTREMIYTHPELTWVSMPPSFHDGYTHHYTTEYIDACDRESRWTQIEPTPTLTPEQQRAVGLHEIACPLCAFPHRVPVLHQGTETGINCYREMLCCCHRLSYYWREWQNMPLRFQRVGELAALTPYPPLKLSVDRQEVIISAMQQHPEDSFLLMGRPETGKTHLLVALYRAALLRSVDNQLAKNDMCQSLWYVNATQLLSQQSIWAVEQNKKFPDTKKEPSVTAAKIASAIKKGYRPCLFVDELDKASLTDSKMAALCGMINQVYEAMGQLVANCNNTAAELAAKWGSDEATTVLRRIGGGDGAHTVLFEG